MCSPYVDRSVTARLIICYRFSVCLLIQPRIKQVVFRPVGYNISMHRLHRNGKLTLCAPELTGGRGPDAAADAKRELKVSNWLTGVARPVSIKCRFDDRGTNELCVVGRNATTSYLDITPLE